MKLKIRFTKEEALARQIHRNKADVKAKAELKSGRAQKRALEAIRRKKEQK